MKLTALPMGRHKAALYDAIGAEDHDQLAVLGDLGYAGAIGGDTDGDLLPESLRDGVLQNWMGKDGFDYTDLGKPAWLDHELAVRQMFTRFVDPQMIGDDRFSPNRDLVFEFENFRVPTDWDEKWLLDGVGAACNAVLFRVSLEARLRRMPVVFSGLALGAAHEPHRYTDRVRGAIAMLGRDQYHPALLKSNARGLLTYRYQDANNGIDAALHSTAYTLWAHDKAIEDSGSGLELWFGISPYYRRSMTPVFHDRLAAQLRVVSDFAPDRVVCWLNVTRPELVEDAAEQFARAQAIAADLP